MTATGVEVPVVAPAATRLAEEAPQWQTALVPFCEDAIAKPLCFAIALEEAIGWALRADAGG